MNHNDLPAFSGKCEGVVISLPHSERLPVASPSPQTQPATGSGRYLRGCRSPVAVPRAPCTRWISTAPARRPLALHRLTARRAERAAIVQADYDKSIDQDQRAVKV